VRPESHLTLNRETLRRLSPSEVQALAAGVDRTATFQVSAGPGGFCSVSMGVTGNSLGCTTSFSIATLGTSVVSLAGPH